MLKSEVRTYEAFVMNVEEWALVEGLKVNAIQSI